MPARPMQFTSRACKRCTELYPADEYRHWSASDPTKYRLSTMCRSCYRAYHRAFKRDQYYGDAEFRERVLERVRRYHHEQMPAEVRQSNNDRNKRTSWIYYRCRAYLDPMPEAIIVYLVPATPRKCDGPVTEARPWRLKTWAVRDDRPGITPPRAGIPVMRIRGANAVTHTMCPDEWSCITHYVNLWLRRRYGAPE